MQRVSLAGIAGILSHANEALDASAIYIAGRFYDAQDWKIQTGAISTREEHKRSSFDRLIGGRQKPGLAWEKSLGASGP